MKLPILSVLLLTLGVLFFQCETNDVEPLSTRADFSCDDSPATCDLTAANGDFAIGVFKQINSGEPADKNIFISPFSISTALTMTTNGAASQTLADMRNTLKISNLSMGSINESYQALLETLPALDPETKLKLANSIWPQIGYPVLESFLETNSTYFGSEVLPVDFNNAEVVIEQVNDWVENNTDGLIEETLEELPGGVVMLLINAIYFKGTWKTEFDEADTEQADFHAPGGPVPVDMMHIPEAGLAYFDTDLFQAVDLPYGDSIFSMSVFLPKEGHNVDEVISELDGESWGQWLGAFEPTAVQLYLPKFKMEYGLKMKRTLSDMGMGLAFTGAADFSKMIDGGGVYIDDVIHKAFVEVNEKGTEAAAVTVVIMIESSAASVQTVNVDRPFLFVIRDNKTNSILFMGKMMNPKA